MHTMKTFPLPGEERVDAEVVPLASIRAPSPLRLVSTADCAKAEPRRYIIKGTIAAGDLALMIGQPGTGKSALTPLLGWAVAQGRGVFGRRVRPGKVLYVPAEDQHGMRSRVVALAKRHGDAPAFFLVDGVTDLFGDPLQATALRALVMVEQPAVVVIDTVAAAFPGLQENESEDMGKVLALARHLTRAADGGRGPAVILLHHPPKGEGKTPRGHGSLNGDADMTLYLSKEEATGLVTAQFTKNRNGPSDGAQFSFTIEAECVGQDEDGDEITAPVAVEAAGAGERRTNLTPTEQRGRELLATVIAEQGSALPTGAGYPSLAYGAAEDAWRAVCEERRLSPAEKMEDRQRAFRRVFTALLNKGSIGANGGLVWIAG